MKQFLILYFILGNAFLVFAQRNGITKDSLSVSKDIKLHKSLTFEDLTITFSNVFQDSRCPKNVNCVRAGEANIEVTVRKPCERAKTVALTIDASGMVSDKNNLITETPNYKIYAFYLSPYPVASMPIDKKHYSLEVVINPKSRD